MTRTWILSAAMSFVTALLPLRADGPAVAAARCFPQARRIAPASRTGGAGRPGGAQSKASLGRRIEDAIREGRGYVRAAQREDGSFGGMHAARYPIGVSALAALALLRSGSKPADPPVARVLAWLSGEQPEKTYAAGLVLVALEAAGVRAGETVGSRASPRRGNPPAAGSLEGPSDPDARTLAASAIRVLIDGQQDATGLWSYPEGKWDLSNTQLALLGLRSARRMGWRIDPAVWMAARDGLVGQQRDDGAFSYRLRSAPSGSMTLAGISSLCVVREALGKGRGQDPEVAAAIDRAMGWFAPRFDPAWNAIGVDGETRAHHFYSLWEVERVGALLGRERLGDHVWYPEGARYLVEAQGADGGWRSVEETCFALLFLSRATITDAPRRPRREAIPRDGGVPSRATSLSPPSAALRPPFPGVPYLTDFLLLGPFPRSEDDAFSTEVVPQEARLVGHAGHLEASRRWQRREARQDGVLDLAAVFGARADHVAFAYTEVRLDSAMDAVLHVGSADGVIAWQDGEEVLRIHRHDALRRDAFTARLHLHRGRNRLLFRVENAGGAWALTARLSRPDGSPLPGPGGASRRGAGTRQ